MRNRNQQLYGFFTTHLLQIYCNQCIMVRVYDREKGFVLRFTMPDHDVKLQCFSRNTMLVDVPEYDTEKSKPEAE